MVSNLKGHDKRASPMGTFFSRFSESCPNYIFSDSGHVLEGFGRPSGVMLRAAAQKQIVNGAKHSPQFLQFSGPFGQNPKVQQNL